MAFSVAYNETIRSEDNMKLCTCVGSMIHSVSFEFHNSVITALVAIGIKPVAARLPADANGILTITD